MALALEGVDLVAVALFLFLLAFLYSLKWTIHPLLNTLHGALGWVPFVGDLVGDADHAIVAALNSAIGGVEEAISTLWAGLVWAFQTFIDEQNQAWGDFAAAVEHAFEVSIPNAFDSLWKEASHLAGQGVTLAGSLKGDAATALKAAELYAAQHAAAALHSATRYTDTQLGKLRDTLAGDVVDARNAATAAEQAAKVAADTVAHAVTGTTSTVTKLVTEQLPADVSALAHELVAAEGAVAGELPRLPGLALDEIEQLLRSKEFGTLAGLLAAIPLVNALVHALAAETGLTDAECRQKVKGICGTNPLRWAHLLEGLALLIAFPTLDEFADACADAVDEVTGVLVDFLGLAG